MVKSSNRSNFNQPEMPLKEGFSYEETVAKVEAIITQIEAGKLDLAAVFDEFTAAVEYLRQCENFLHEKQQQMDLLIETLEDTPESF
ncbi:MAG TPA: exodeoxyribonuclease VII small subunit [Cyanobacteria bacterium UBA11369]|nr:exodeoxyribonuclease VII small subunit [Cyanobacteria bacterium UBA8553]HAZ43652.1 exodeoxyribonuclease VII small subunit [Cyanobacteria bacterium UBA11371]HBE35846.1 exodeoxyribonuclease VII small subunit [Cyanobacteria bacterium UBA11368]HBE53074.1 exodeoxyribonuclease VII small subunit [Cyanobacteria bacterium UBA11369]